MSSKVHIVGAGPAGLFCAYLLLQKGYQVDLYDQMPGVGKKFLIAGIGGLNLTHSEELDIFASRYGKDEALFAQLLNDFSPHDLRQWCTSLGVDTFIGVSGRVFPRKLKAADLLLKWLNALKSNHGFKLYLKHRLTDFTQDKILTFHDIHLNQNITVNAEKVIFALGGASWEKTGSDGLWSKLFAKLQIEVKPFLPMNCGFETNWSDYLVKKIDRAPLKNITLKFNHSKIRGEVMITPFGIEGSAIYALSNSIRDEIIDTGEATISIDLKPDLSLDMIKNKLSKKNKKESMTNFLRKSLKIDQTMYTLLSELSDSTQFNDNNYLSHQIKHLKIKLLTTRPLSEAISTSGGVCFLGLLKNLELKSMPGVFIAGEMLDFEAPTGGYLLQACFSTAYQIVNSITKK